MSLLQADVVRRPRRALLIAAVAGSALATPLVGGSSAAVTLPVTSLTPSTADAGSDAVALLEDAYRRSRSETYSGVQVVTVDNQTHVVRVSHVPGHTYLAAPGATSQSFSISDAGPAGSATDPLSRDPLALLKQHYQLTALGTDQLATGAAIVVTATALDGRVAAEFWVDVQTRLLVRRDTFDSNQNPYTQVQYSSLDVGASGAVGAVDPALTEVTSTPVTAQGTPEDAGRLGQLRARGWWAQPTLPGQLTLYDAREVTSTTGTVLHLSYSDGISTVSVFEQRGRLAGAATLPAGWVSVTMPDGRRVVQATAAPTRAAWQAHTLVVAVVADVPPASVAAVLDALPYGAAPAGHGMVLGRLTRGLHRIGAGLSSLNPFG